MGENIYGGQDPREMPAYSIAEAAHYLQLPPSTLRAWVCGRYYPTEGGQKLFAPLICLPTTSGNGPPLLSFMNLVEAHVLCALRRQHRLSLHKVREALSYLEAQIPSSHPLADQTFETDGIDLFIEHYGQLIKITAEGQLAMRQMIQAHLRRVERDPAGIPIRLYPFTRDVHVPEAKVIMIDPYVSFGRPVLARTGIVTAIIAERYLAGESIDDLARDYARSRLEIEEVLRCELQDRAA